MPSIHSLFEQFQRVQDEIDNIEGADKEESVRDDVEIKYYATLAKIEDILYQSNRVLHQQPPVLNVPHSSLIHPSFLVVIRV